MSRRGDPEEYPGTAIHPSLPRGRVDCVLTLRGSSIVARLPSGDRLSVELHRARFDRHGPDLRNYSYGGLAYGSPTLVTTDPRLHEAIVAAGLLGQDGTRTVSQPARRIEAQLTRGQKMVVAAVAAAIVVCAIPFLLAGPLAPLAVRAIPTSTDRKMGEGAIAEAVSALSDGRGPDRKKECDQPPIRNVIDAVMDRLQLALQGSPQARGFAFKVHVVDSDMVNAFALPGGPILVTTKLLSMLDGPDELAGVLAHEINHVTRRHGVEKMVREKGVSMLFQNSDGVGTLLIANAAFLGSMSFSRDNESDADDGGVDLAWSAGIDPRGLLGFFKKVEVLEHGDCAKASSGIAFTHPLTGERIARTRKRIADQKPIAFTPIEADWAAMDKELDRMAQEDAERGVRHRRPAMFPWGPQ